MNLKLLLFPLYMICMFSVPSYAAPEKTVTYDTFVTCTEDADYDFKQVGIVQADGPLAFGLVVEVNEDDGLSRNTEDFYTPDIHVIKVDSNTTRYSDKYQTFELVVKETAGGKLLGHFSRIFDGPGSYELENLSCRFDDKIKVLE